MKDSPNLDLLRAIAVCLVVGSHLGLNLGWARGHDIELVGRIGVAMFFVHTSLVLMMSLERTGETAAQFLIRRFFRIYPLSVAIVLLVSLGNQLGVVPVDPWALVSNLLLIQNITGHASNPPPLWSLPYEVQMYLILPAISVGLRNPVLMLQLAAIVFGLVAVVLPMWLLNHLYLLQYVPCFLAGVLAFALGRRVEARFGPLWLFLVVAVSAAAVTALAWSGVPETPLFWVLCLVLGLTIPLCRQLTFKPLAAAAKTVAKYSYSIYLTHLIAMLFGFSLFPDLPLVLRWVMFLTVLAMWARVAYRWIEAPGMRLGAKIAARLQQQTQTTGRADAEATGAEISPVLSK